MYPNCTYSNLQKWSYMVSLLRLISTLCMCSGCMHSVNCLVNTHVTVGTLAF